MSFLWKIRLKIFVANSSQKRAVLLKTDIMVTGRMKVELILAINPQ
jgi:hypothetical protein